MFPGGSGAKAIRAAPAHDQRRARESARARGAWPRRPAQPRGGGGGGFLGIASPRWHVAHCTLVMSAAGFPRPDASVSLTWFIIVIITRAVFLGAFSSVAKSFRPPRPSWTWQ